MNWLFDPWSLGFMRLALAAGVLTAIITAVAGTWVVVRGLSFMGDALAHGVLPGMSLAVLLRQNVQIGAVLSALVMVLGINQIRRRSRLSEDTSIGLLFVGMLALGVIIISRSGSFTVSLTSLLFGDILGVAETDIVLGLAAAVASVAVTVLFYRPFVALSFNRQKAEALGMRPDLAHFTMLALIALAIIASFQTVGTLLVFGLLVAPPATAITMRVRGIPAIMTVAAVAGCLSVLAGLMLSYYFGTAASATIAGVAVAVFFLSMLGRDVHYVIMQRKIPGPNRP